MSHTAEFGHTPENPLVRDFLALTSQIRDMEKPSDFPITTRFDDEGGCDLTIVTSSRAEGRPYTTYETITYASQSNEFTRYFDAESMDEPEVTQAPTDVSLEEITERILENLHRNPELAAKLFKAADAVATEKALGVDAVSQAEVAQFLERVRSLAGLETDTR